MDREVEEIRIKRVKEGPLVVQKRRAFDRDILVAEIQLFDHEGFREGDYVTITVEKKLEK